MSDCSAIPGLQKFNTCVVIMPYCVIRYSIHLGVLCTPEISCLHTTLVVMVVIAILLTIFPFMHMLIFECHPFCPSLVQYNLCSFQKELVTQLHMLSALTIHYTTAHAQYSLYLVTVSCPRSRRVTLACSMF